MRPVRFRFLLPLIFGCLAIALTAWEFQNQKTIEDMGMAWDTGPPIWPYQTSWILLQGINAPAYALDMPLCILLRVRSSPTCLLIELPTIFLWWWFVGWRVDLRLSLQRNVRQNRLWGPLFCVASLGFWSCAIYLVEQQVVFWFGYGSVGWRGPLLYLLRNAGILCWCLLLAIWSTVVAVQFTIPLLNRKR